MAYAHKPFSAYFWTAEDLVVEGFPVRLQPYRYTADNFQYEFAPVPDKTLVFSSNGRRYRTSFVGWTYESSSAFEGWESRITEDANHHLHVDGSQTEEIFPEYYGGAPLNVTAHYTATLISGSNPNYNKDLAYPRRVTVQKNPGHIGTVSGNCWVLEGGEYEISASLRPGNTIDAGYAFDIWQASDGETSSAAESTLIYPQGVRYLTWTAYFKYIRIDVHASGACALYGGVVDPRTGDVGPVVNFFFKSGDRADFRYYIDEDAAQAWQINGFTVHQTAPADSSRSAIDRTWTMLSPGSGQTWSSTVETVTDPATGRTWNRVVIMFSLPLDDYGSVYEVSPQVAPVGFTTITLAIVGMYSQHGRLPSISGAEYCSAPYVVELSSGKFRVPVKTPLRTSRAFTLNDSPYAANQYQFYSLCPEVDSGYKIRGVRISKYNPDGTVLQSAQTFWSPDSDDYYAMYSIDDGWAMRVANEAFDGVEDWTPSHSGSGKERVYMASATSSYVIEFYLGPATSSLLCTGAGVMLCNSSGQLLYAG